MSYGTNSARKQGVLAAYRRRQRQREETRRLMECLAETDRSLDCRFKIAGPIAGRILDWLELAAIVSPWRTIYVLPEWWLDEPLREHELEHIRQLDRDGPVKFWFYICWWCLTKGYRNSPYEIEARRAERKAGPSW